VGVRSYARSTVVVSFVEDKSLFFDASFSRVVEANAPPRNGPFRTHGLRFIPETAQPAWRHGICSLLGFLNVLKRNAHGIAEPEPPAA
jgi:hypothetical protein